MPKLSVCVLTFNSQRTLAECLPPLFKVADELIVVDSGSHDATLGILHGFGVTPIYRPYTTHADQMNHATELATNDWVLCIDSDEVLDEACVSSILALKDQLEKDDTAYRLARRWFVLGSEVHAIYPVSSPDYPVRLFNRTKVRFNDAPVDDKPEGFTETKVIGGSVKHDTFYSLHELYSKLNSYTSRLVQHRPIKPSLTKAIVSALGAFVKWYFIKGGWRDGRVGVATAAYAMMYSFFKYFKPWLLKNKNIKLY